MATAKKKAQYMMDYRQREVLLSMGLSPLSGSIPWPLLDVEETTTETVDPETIEALIDRETPEDVIQLKELEADMEYLLDSLTPKERKVLKLRFGIGLPKDYTLEEVGKMLDVTKERVRQIEAKALRKMRHPSRSDKLKLCLFDDYELESMYDFLKIAPPSYDPDFDNFAQYQSKLASWNLVRKKAIVRIQELKEFIKSGKSNYKGEVDDWLELQ